MTAESYVLPNAVMPYQTATIDCRAPKRGPSRRPTNGDET
jgi:hypothetical protein